MFKIKLNKKLIKMQIFFNTKLNLHLTTHIHKYTPFILFKIIMQYTLTYTTIS